MFEIKACKWVRGLHAIGTFGRVLFTLVDHPWTLVDAFFTGPVT